LQKITRFPGLSIYHSVIHQQALCIEAIDVQHVMSVVQKKKNVNSIRGWPLQHRLFKHLLHEIGVHYGDLILHTEVGWLSTGNILFTF
jgi:hypothetical protein